MSNVIAVMRLPAVHSAKILSIIIALVVLAGSSQGRQYVSCDWSDNAFRQWSAN